MKNTIIALAILSALTLTGCGLTGSEEASSSIQKTAIVQEATIETAAQRMAADSQNMVMIENKALRNVAWIEVILWVGEGENAKGGATFSTMGFDAPQKFVKTLDKKALLTKYDAAAVSLNPDTGIKYWTCDEFHVVSSATIRNYNGINTRYVGTVTPLADGSPVNISEKAVKQMQYKNMGFDRESKLIFEAGKPVFVITEADGTKWVNKNFQTGIMKDLTIEKMHKLDQYLTQMPEGWSYGTVILKEDLVLIADGSSYPIMWDEFGGAYDIVYDADIKKHNL